MPKGLAIRTFRTLPCASTTIHNSTIPCEFSLARFFRVGGFRGVNGDGRADVAANTEGASAAASIFARTVTGTFARSHSRAIAIANSAARPRAAREWSWHALGVAPGHVQLHGRELQFRGTQQGRRHRQERRNFWNLDPGWSELRACEVRKGADAKREWENGHRLLPRRRFSHA